MSRDNYRNRTENCSVTSCYNEVQNIILRLLFIAVVVTPDLCFKRVPNNKANIGNKIVLCITRKSFVILLPTEIQTKKKKSWQHTNMVHNKCCVFCLGKHTGRRTVTWQLSVYFMNSRKTNPHKYIQPIICYISSRQLFLINLSISHVISS